MPKELGLFYVVLLTVPLYIRWDQFIIAQATLPTPSHLVPSNFMLVFKRLHLNLLDIVTFSTLMVNLGDHPTRIKTIYTIFKYKFIKFNPQMNRNIFVLTVCSLSNQNLSHLIHQ